MNLYFDYRKQLTNFIEDVRALRASYPKYSFKRSISLDNVIGRERLPNFSDEADLPFITAVCKELLRWTSPTGMYQIIYSEKGFNSVSIA